MGLIVSLASWTKGELTVCASTVVCIWSLLVTGSEHPYLWLRVFLPGPLFYKVGTDKVLGLGRNFVEVQNAAPAALGSSVRATHLLSPSPYRPTGKHPWTSHEREHHPQERATETHRKFTGEKRRRRSAAVAPHPPQLILRTRLLLFLIFSRGEYCWEAPTGKISCFFS